MKKQTKKERNATKDPNTRRGLQVPSCFTEDFRKQFKESYPAKKSVAVVGRTRGDKWKLFSDEQRLGTRYSGYEAKMKSMEEKWQHQIASLQLANELAATENSLGTPNTPR